MPSDQHAQPPDSHPPCDCGGCQEFRAIYAQPRHEYSREQHAIDRAITAERTRRRRAA